MQKASQTKAVTLRSKIPHLSPLPADYVST